VNIRAWWKRKRFAAKAMVVLPLLLILQIGLLFATPSLQQWADSISHVPQGEGWGTMGLILWELWLCVLTVLLMGIVAMWWLVGSIAGKMRTRKDSDA
jgi:uncharacterized BrkB/YihY/UPF0761 family membrane protein